MIINHNMMSDNAHRFMGVNAAGMGKSVEKLSSGMKINRAADDAAGLYISEKMRSQVRGLKQASANSLDGISAVQTAEGALDEVHSMLQRMRELAVKAGNETNQDEDKKAIDAEMDELADEIQSISDKTQFNKQVLLDGSFTKKKLQTGANQGQTLDINIESMSAVKLGLGEIKDWGSTPAKGATWSADFSDISVEQFPNEYKLDITVKDGANPNVNTTLSLKAEDGKPITAQTVADKINADSELKKLVKAEAKDGKVTLTSIKTGEAMKADTIEMKVNNTILESTALNKDDVGIKTDITGVDNGGKVKLADADDFVDITGLNKNDRYELEFDMNGVTRTISVAPNADGKITLDDVVNAINADTEVSKTFTATKDGNKLVLESKNNLADPGNYTLKGAELKQDVTAVKDIGFKADKNATVTATTKDGVDAVASGQKTFRSTLDVMSSDAINKAGGTLEKIDKAIAEVSRQRSNLGAVQNRLEHTIKNLDNAAENTQTAESRIRDTDMAKEMSKFTKDNILTQASQAMLAQANQLPQQVLQLLR
ncbi:flagellin N-terminal helical domain-containing protein [Criibacterium bergeronii]|uniref:Flagellin n=2 Tax=Filifactoraceae TaxID=3118655 RepID=A0A371IJ89_9FIRM|nr:flagellin [Criibacterium bergeronii]RDY20545.1 flagellin [Criibacterium bergeronii]